MNKFLYCFSPLLLHTTDITIEICWKELRDKIDQVWVKGWLFSTLVNFPDNWNVRIWWKSISSANLLVVFRYYGLACLASSKSLQQKRKENVMLSLRKKRFVTLRKSQHACTDYDCDNQPFHVTYKYLCLCFDCYYYQLLSVNCNVKLYHKHSDSLQSCNSLIS